ncbi:hypothetical protein [Nocardioides sp. SYSU DS0651]|uniref:hypothetical protein n=1 Tax=Nocardioides sp. SYSU DS0651 TaxID=3415955 RepID=UPI003F4AF8C7
MKLHQALADLARDHGHELFRDAGAFRGSLDDYLDEGQASSGTINLLTDAVRLGALDGMLTMLSSGAAPADAVESAGQRLARDRGSADVRGCQWAVAVLGFALGKVPEQLVTGLDPEAATAAPPHHGPGGTAPIQSPGQSPGQPPIQSPQHPVHSPAQSPAQSPVQSPQHPVHSPAAGVHHQSGGAGYGSPQAPYSGGGWSPQPPRKSRTGLVVGVAVAGLVLIIAGIVGIIALTGGDDDPKADDPTSETTEPTDLGGPTIEGTGYTVQVPEGWSDGTEEFKSNNPGLATLDRVILWGDSFNTARGNIIVETQSAYGSTDPNDLKEDWKKALVSSDPSAQVTDIPNRAIDGQTALGVEISRTNDSGVAVKQRAHLVISGDKGYSITASLKEGDEEVLTRFDDILSTWQWAE